MPIPPRSGSSGPKKSGFSLVEVAIALGIASFVLISLLGLMSTGLDAGKQSTEDVMLATLAKTVLSDLKSTNNYHALNNFSTNRYFAYSGTEVSQGSKDAYFGCKITAGAHTNSPFPALTNASNAVRVTVNFSWPVGVTNNEQIFETTVARF